MTNTNYPKAIRRCKPARVYLLPALLACSAATWANTDSSPTSVPDFDSQLPVLGGDIPEVLTTTRLRQPKTRVPGSTTVIEGETIRDLGLMHLYEVFRLVPGMTVNFVGSHQPSVTYHGTSHYEQRRMQGPLTSLPGIRPIPPVSKPTSAAVPEATAAPSARSAAPARQWTGD